MKVNVKAVLTQNRTKNILFDLAYTSGRVVSVRVDTLACTVLVVLNGTNRGGHEEEETFLSSS